MVQVADSLAALRRDADVPPTLQLYRALSEAIKSGDFRPGARLPAERSLCDQLSVSRVTLRHVLRALESEGLVSSSRGSGWYVATDVVGESSNALLSFTELARTRGLTPSAQVISSEVRPATIEEADRLRIAPGTELYDLERLRMLDGVAVAVQRGCLPLALAPELPEMDFTHASLYEVLENRYGLSPRRAEYSVQAEGCEQRHADLLGLEEGAPVLVGSWQAFGQDRKPIEIGRVVYRGDRYRFQATLTRVQPATNSEVTDL